jgi:hypothetical protein
MAILIVLFVSLLAYRAAGVLGVEWLASWQPAARWALSTMLLFTAGAHFTRMRDDLVVVRVGHYKGSTVGSEGFKKALALLIEAVPEKK